jgi:hypothetical protein
MLSPHPRQRRRDLRLGLPEDLPDPLFRHAPARAAVQLIGHLLLGANE